jgi:hypothetical protein
MWWTLLAFLALCEGVLMAPVRALAQTQQPPAPPPDYWYGPGFMWGWSSFWWICPLMMVVMMLAMMFACRFMGSWHRD